MSRNHLTPQDYSSMTLSYLYKFTSLIFPVSVSKITNYCVKHSKELDFGDEVEIRKIVSTTLKTLEIHGYLAHAGGESYCVIKSLSDVDIVVFDNPEIKPNYKIVNEYLSNIDKRTRYGKLEAQNEETKTLNNLQEPKKNKELQTSKVIKNENNNQSGLERE